MTRDRLLDRLDAGSEAALTLLSAPAGFGKTTLVAEWLGRVGRPAAWVSIEARDNDPALFWIAVLAAVDQAAPGQASRAAADLERAPTPVEPVLTTLVNELEDSAIDLVLVVDDYHLIEAPDVHEGMAFLLEHLPLGVQLVIASRADPPLPLARLRARGELVEIRAADLRFTADETAAYLNDSVGLGLTPEDVGTLETRTEGWIAALQLAGLSMQGREDVAGFIAEFAGDDRFVVDYLADEVLARQPGNVRRFLLETSVLNRLTGPLCDEITGREGGRAMLEALDRANLFLVPLDDRRRWYRYHHLFAEVLRAHLLAEDPAVVPQLHRRASDWFEADGDRAEAIAHAIAGGDLERAADLVELATPGLGQARQDATLRAHLEALPDAVYEHRPVLTVARVGSLMVRGEVTGVDAWLDQAERLLGDPSAVVVDQEQFVRLPSQIVMYRTGVAHLSGDLQRVIGNASHLLEVVAPDDHLSRGAAQAFLALANWGMGELAEAERWEREAIATFERSGYVSDALGCSLALADIQGALGRLHDAQRSLEHGLELAGDQVVRGRADMHVALSELCRERNDLAGARSHLAASEELGEGAELPQNPYRRRVASALVLAAEGDLAGAVDLLDEAEPLVNTDFSPPVRPVAAVQARVQLRLGDVRAARRWARALRLSIDDELPYVREYEHLTLARLLLAEGAVDEADLLLDRLLAAAREGERGRTVIEALVLLGRIEEAQALAEQEGYVRLLLDEGRALSNHRSAATSTAPQVALVDPLSERELDVLRLLRTDLSGPEIATELFVSLNTLRTHTRRIYTKLGVTSRRAAVTRADEIGL